ncbi:MAG: hypothetical protein JW984_04995 [Deltaproteobacteria bacterium]|uniref:Uncharacterized protein n=1 Tax=Candidatus Zymogenus saltonus TaxID=2844893 RepID=A0A9D8PNE7_9DELT|nr:hypothetical protein [Candidatus Zymogenus saltonus]
MRTETAKIIEIDFEEESILGSEVEEIKNLDDFEIFAEKKGILVAFERMTHHGILARENGNTVMIINKILPQDQQTLVAFHLYCRYIMSSEEMYAINLPDNYVLLRLFLDLHGDL